MSKIILHFSFIWMLCLHGNGAEQYLGQVDSIDELTNQFAIITRRGTNDSIQTSESLTSPIEIKEKRSQSGSLSTFIYHSNSDDESDDNYEERMEAIGKCLFEREQKIKRKFNKTSLIDFILENQRISKDQLNLNSLDLEQHIGMVETFLMLSLQNLEKDLRSALQEDNSRNYAELTDPHKLIEYHKQNISTINTPLARITIIDITLLTFRYYTMTLSDLIYKYCKPETNDLPEIWQKKSSVFILSHQMYLNAFSNFIFNDAKLKRTAQKAAQTNLISFFNDSCTYFQHWYEHNRSTITQGMSWIGARKSRTKETFDTFAKDYPRYFSFLYEDELIKEELNHKWEDTLGYFARVDEKFSESVSTLTSLFSWPGSSSNNPQPSNDTPSSLSNLLGGWFSSSSGTPSQQSKKSSWW